MTMLRKLFSILVVDDTKVNIDVLMETLGDDYEISGVLNGEKALEDISIIF